MKNDSSWPELPLDSWKETCDTLHLWMQIVGKVKLELTPFLNEWWGIGFEVTARGLSTGAIPSGDRIFEVRFDFIDHQLYVNVSDGQKAELSLGPRPVADFYREFLSRLRELKIDVTIRTKPVEIPVDTPFDMNYQDASYDPERARDWWTILTHTTRVLQRYRSDFVGKSSPILFYWGSFDLSCTRYSGRQTPMPAKGPRFYKIGEDQENICCGFWPGNANANGLSYGKPAFFSYIYPPPPGIESARLQPDKASFHRELGEFVLDYEQVRKSTSPESTLLEFFQSAYEAEARLAGWDRARLEQSLESLMARAAGPKSAA